MLTFLIDSETERHGQAVNIPHRKPAGCGQYPLDLPDDHFDGGNCIPERRSDAESAAPTSVDSPPNEWRTTGGHLHQSKFSYINKLLYNY